MSAKIRQAKPARFVGLPEDDLLLLAMKRTPGADAPLQRPADALAEFGPTAHHLLENGNGSQAGSRLQHRHDLGVEYIGKRIGSPALSRFGLLGWRSRIAFDAIGGGQADRCLRGRDGGGVSLTELHEKPHLVIGYMAPGHEAVPSREEKPPAYPVDRDHQTAPNERRRRLACDSSRASPSLRHTPTGILILIDVTLSS